MEGEPTEPSSGYGYAKRFSEVLGMKRHEAGHKTIIVRPFNCYGPGDNFSPDSSHVIPALMSKISAGGPVKVWGDGEQVRSFTFISDWVDALLLLAEKWKSGIPVNLAATDQGVSIRVLAETIMRLTGQSRELVFEPGPVGHSRRVPDLSGLYGLGWEGSVSLEDGLIRTWRSMSA